MLWNWSYNGSRPHVNHKSERKNTFSRYSRVALCGWVNGGRGRGLMGLKTNQTLAGICQTFVKSLFPSRWGRRGITGLPKGGDVFTAEFHIFYDFNRENLTTAVPCFFKTYFNFFPKSALNYKWVSVVKFLNFIYSLHTRYLHLFKPFLGVKHFFMSWGLYSRFCITLLASPWDLCSFQMN